MKARTALAIAALVALTLPMLSKSSEAAGQLRVRFSFDGVSSCKNPPISNFPIHGEGTGVLSADRSATLDMNSSVEGRVEYRAKLGGAPQEAPAGSAALRVVGRHTLRAIRDYPNNQVLINITVRGNVCTMTIDQRLKPGKREYTFFNGSGVSICSRPTFTRTSCESY